MSSILPDLEELLTYRNEVIILDYMENYKTSQEFAETMFKEMLKFLWLRQKSKISGDNVYVYMYEPHMVCMDWMWHTFILFTRDYEQFCNQYFGDYFHHRPIVGEDEKQRTKEKLYDFLEYVRRHLGRETVSFWFCKDHRRVVERFKQHQDLYKLT